jgi:Sec-independent protein translocase protein TatA
MEIFNVGGPELILLLFLAGVLLGPRRMVLLAREMGELLSQIKLISRNLTKELNREIDLLDREMRVTLPELTVEKADSDEVEADASGPLLDQIESREIASPAREDLPSNGHSSTQSTEAGENSRLPEAYLRFIEDFPGEGLVSEGLENKGLGKEDLESEGPENEGMENEGLEEQPSTSAVGAHSE